MKNTFKVWKRKKQLSSKKLKLIFQGIYNYDNQITFFISRSNTFHRFCTSNSKNTHHTTDPLKPPSQTLFHTHSEIRRLIIDPHEKLHPRTPPQCFSGDSPPAIDKTMIYNQWTPPQFVLLSWGEGGCYPPNPTYRASPGTQGGREAQDEWKRGWSLKGAPLKRVGR